MALAVVTLHGTERTQRVLVRSTPLQASVPGPHHKRAEEWGSGRRYVSQRVCVPTQSAMVVYA